MTMEEKKLTLTDYIESNKTLLSALGVFIALTVFSAKIELNFFAITISLLSLTCVMLICLELWSGFPRQGGTLKLVFFENSLSYLALSFLIYWFVKIKYTFPKEFFIYFTFLLILSISITMFSLIIKKTNIFNKVFKTTNNNKRFIRYILGINILIIFFLISLKITEIITPFIDQFINQIN